MKADKSYQGLLQELRSILSNGLHKAYKAVDNLKVQTYWQLGERIVREELANKDRADYGKFLVDRLVIDLRIPQRRLYEIIQFYRAYPILRTLSAKLSWSHYIELIEISEEKKRAFYQNKAILHSWSVRELRDRIKSRLFEQTSPQEIEEVFKTKLPAISPQQIFKDTYDFNFIELEHHENENLRT